MSAILISDDANNWYESGIVSDVTIRNNQFIECGLPVINIAPQNQISVPGKSVHHNIHITGNSFDVQNGPVIAARSVDGLWAKNNFFRQRGHTPKSMMVNLISINDCKNVVIAGNNVQAGVIPTVRVSKKMDKDIGGNLKSDWKLKF